MEETHLAFNHAAVAARLLPANSLHLSREKLSIVLEGIADGITALNPAGELIYGNDAAARLIGYPSVQALLAVPAAEVMHKFEMFDAAGHPLPVDELPGRRALRGLVDPPRVLRFRVRETGEERWTFSLGPASFAVKFPTLLGDEPLLRLVGRIEADEHRAATLTGMDVQYGSFLVPLKSVFSRSAGSARAGRGRASR